VIKRNIVANLFGRVWGFVSVFIFIPLYLKFLGVEAFGLVGFYSTLMGILVFADMGLTATLNREMARLSVREDSAGDKCDLLRTYELTYTCISFLLALAVWFVAPLISDYWLQSKTLDPQEVTPVIRLMGVSIAVQLPASLYIGGLMGLQKQVLSNSLQIGWSMLRGMGSVLVLWLLCPTIYAFVCWQLFSNVAYCLFARTTIWHAVASGCARPRFNWLVFRNTWRYAMGMAGMASISILLTQTDKLAVSKMLPLETFGYYMLAVTLAGVPMMIASPISMAVFPRLTGLVESNERDGLVTLYHRAASMVSVAVIPTGLTLAIFSSDVIFAWTGNIVASREVGLVASFRLCGELMQAVTIVPFYVALSHGNVKLNLKIGAISIILITPLLIYLISKYGVVGAGASWVVMNLCTLPPYMYFLHRRFLSGELWRWCLRDVGIPLLAALPCVLFGRWIVPHTNSRFMMLALIGLVWGITTAATAITVPELRSLIMKQTSRVFGVSI